MKVILYKSYVESLNYKVYLYSNFKNIKNFENKTKHRN